MSSYRARQDRRRLRHRLRDATTQVIELSGQVVQLRNRLQARYGHEYQVADELDPTCTLETQAARMEQDLISCMRADHLFIPRQIATARTTALLIALRVARITDDCTL